jgi:hypothetical protein
MQFPRESVGLDIYLHCRGILCTSMNLPYFSYLRLPSRYFYCYWYSVLELKFKMYTPPPPPRGAQEPRSIPVSKLSKVDAPKTPPISNSRFKVHLHTTTSRPFTQRRLHRPLNQVCPFNKSLVLQPESTQSSCVHQSLSISLRPVAPWHSLTSSSPFPLLELLYQVAQRSLSPGQTLELRPQSRTSLRTNYS